MTERRPVIGVPGEVVDTVAGLRSAVGVVVLVGGWAVHCRLAMGRSRARPTSDLDVLLGADSRPRLRTLLGQVGAGGLSTQSRLSGYEPEADRLRLAVEGVLSRVAA